MPRLSDSYTVTIKILTPAFRGNFRLAFLLICYLAFGVLPTPAATVHVVIDNKEVLLDRIEFEDRTVPVESMIGLSDVFHFGATPLDASSASSSTTIISPNSAASILPNERHRLLTGDTALNTGFASVGGGLGLLTSSSLPILGMGVRFELPIRNGDGSDIVVFGFSNFSIGKNTTSFYANAIQGNEVLEAALISQSPTAPLAFGTLPMPGDVTSPVLYKQTNPMSSYSTLETNTLVAPTPFFVPSGYLLRLYEIDLTDLGIPFGETITGMYFQSNGLTSALAFNPTFIAGFYHAPEPGSFALMGFGLAAVAASRRFSRCRVRA